MEPDRRFPARIVQSSDNRLFCVEESADPALSHVWIGLEVKRVKGHYQPKIGATRHLVRKAGCRTIEGVSHV